MATKKTKPAAKEPKTVDAATWFYGKEGSKLVKPGELIPNGFFDSPAKVK